MTSFKGPFQIAEEKITYFQSAQYTPCSLMEINNKKMLPLIAAPLYICTEHEFTQPIG
jgi:hypothetical protein